MRKLTYGDKTIYDDTEHLVLEITDETTLLDFTRQIDDLLIVTPEGDILMSWKINHDSAEFPDDECILLTPKDNLKEIGNLKTTLFALRAREKGVKLKVYITAQRN